MKKFKIAIGSDHNGFIYKENLRDFLKVYYLSLVFTVSLPPSLKY